MDWVSALEKLGPTGTLLAILVFGAKWALPRLDRWLKEREQVVRDMQNKFLEKLEQKDERIDQERERYVSALQTHASELNALTSQIVAAGLEPRAGTKTPG